jgi:hypothetical protein
MPLVLSLVSNSIRRCRRGLMRSFSRLCQAALVAIFYTSPAWSVPVILNQPLTILPGNIVGVEGSQFKVTLKVNLNKTHVIAINSIRYGPLERRDDGRLMQISDYL